MTYESAVEYIHSLLKFGMNLGLERVSALLDMLGNPQNDLRFVHVAGTNGKGTTSTMLSEILKSAGNKTGLFTSPYVFSFCERVQIDNVPITHNELAKITQRVKICIDALSEKGITVTEFEAVTAIALVYFKEQKCDYVVLEVGLGGRFDSTNVIPCPRVAVITSIAMDHMSVLGDTIEKIAYEKCGIIKDGGTVVTTSLQDENALSVIKKAVCEKQAQLVTADFCQVNVLSKDIHSTKITYKNEEYIIPLVGDHQIENTIAVIEAAKTLGIGSEDIYKGIKNTVMHGRMEIVSRNPQVMLDGGHNEECSLALKNVIEKYVKSDITAVIGMMADKDCDKYLGNILPLCKKAVFTTPDNPRSEAAVNLAEIAKAYIDDIVIENNPEKAYNKALECAAQNGFVLVCGSFYLLSDIFKA